MRKIPSSNAGITKIILIIILIIFLIVVYSSADAKNISMSKIESALKAKTDMGQMQKCNNRQLKEFISLDSSNFTSVMYYKSKEALDVSEILIVKAKHRDDLDAVQDAVDERISSQISTFDSYGPSQVAMLKNAVVIKKGKYLFYCVNKNPDKYEEVFKHVI